MTFRRSGALISQPGGYRAFVPRSLPPHPPIEYDAEMLDLLSEADRALGRLDGAASTLPNPDLFVFVYIRREAAHSSQIEGTQASLIDLLQFEAHAVQGDQPVDVEEIANYVAAMNLGLELLDRLPVSLRLIRRIHERLLSDVRGSDRTPGRFRKSQNWIGPPGCTLGDASFVPPPPAEMIDALGQWEDFIHSRARMPPLIKVGLAHAQFETIHPFLDGNGRVGRLLITFLLVEKRILTRPLLYLSHFFVQNRSEYYERLQATRDQGDWEGWLRFFLRGVAKVAKEATENAHEIVAMRELHRDMITAGLGRGAGKALVLLERLYYQPMVNVPSVMAITGLTSAPANALVLKLEGMGLLQEMSGRRRNRIFAYAPYMRFLEG